MHGREGDPLAQPLHDPDSHQEVDAGVGSPRGDEGENGGHQDSQTVEPFATPQLSQSPTRNLGQHVPVEKRTKDQALQEKNLTWSAFRQESKDFVFQSVGQ